MSSPMSKKDYEAVASVIHDAVRQAPIDHRTSLVLVIEGLAHRFAQDNPRFLRSRFIEACLIGQVCGACGRSPKGTTFCKASDDGKHPTA